MHTKQKQRWTNWSGDIQFEPAMAATPANEQELQQIIQQAIANKQTIRAIGSRHSCSTIFATNQIVVTLENFKGLSGKS